MFVENGEENVDIFYVGVYVLIIEWNYGMSGVVNNDI